MALLGLQPLLQGVPTLLCLPLLLKLLMPGKRVVYVGVHSFHNGVKSGKGDEAGAAEVLGDVANVLIKCRQSPAVPAENEADVRAVSMGGSAQQDQIT